VVGDRRKSQFASKLGNIEAGSAIFSDELKSHDGLENEDQHAVISHAVEYVNRNLHANIMEKFWSLLKRRLHGTDISVEPFHVFCTSASRRFDIIKGTRKMRSGL